MRNLASLFAIAAVALAWSQPDLSAKSAVVIEATTGEVLFDKAGSVPRYPASTTKILTGLLIAENTRPHEIVVAPPDIEEVGESSMNLRPGERVPAEDLLYAVMLRSANDGAVAAARHISGSVEDFARLMNDRAREIGANDTEFVNPHGLHDDRHVTTAIDLALIGREALRNDRFAAAARTQSMNIERSLNEDDTRVDNRNAFLANFPGGLGIKTGWTTPAGRCFVGAAERNGTRFITVVLASEDWLADTVALMDWAFDSFAMVEAIPAGQVVGQVPVRRGSIDNLDVRIDEPVAEVLPADAEAGQPDVAILFENEEQPVAPIREGAKVGIARIVLPNGSMHERNVYAVQAVDARPGVGRFLAPIAWVVLGFVIALVLFVATKPKRSAKAANYRYARK